MKRLEEQVRLRINRVRNWNFERQSGKLVKDLEAALAKREDEIPVLVVSYNNGRYVQNTVQQLKAYAIKPIIIDNCSTDDQSRSMLRNIASSGDAEVVYSDKNFGYLVGFLNPVYAVLPELFAYTDPDLQFHPDLPHDFLQVLADVTEQYKVYKAGFALALLEEEEMINLEIEKLRGVPKIYPFKMRVREWEMQYWRMKLEHPNLELYQARHDTTFAVYRKSNLIDFYDGVRVAGNFTAIHLPWYPKLDLMNDQERQRYLMGNRSSTWISGDT
jgi:hypothetical protein